MRWRLNERRGFLLRRKRPCNGLRSSPPPCQQWCESPSSEMPRAIIETGDKLKMATNQAYDYEEFFMKF